MHRNLFTALSGTSGWRSTVTHGMALLIVFSAVGASGMFMGYTLGRTNANIRQSRSLRGYATPCPLLPPPVFDVEGWTGVVLDADTTYTDGAHNVVLHDVDGDGQLEVVANSFRSDALMYYRCDGDARDPEAWKRHVVDVDVGDGYPTRPIHAFAQSVIREKLLNGCTGGAHYTAIDDLNGDGMADLVVAGDFKKCDVVYYEARRSASSVSWSRHCLYRNDRHRTYQIETGDVDGDGRCDVVLATKTDHRLGWLRNNGSLEAWPVTWIATELTNCFYARVVDMDGDGRGEVLATQDTAGQGGRLWLFTCAGDASRPEDWRSEAIARFPPGHGASVFEVADFNDDGIADVVVANHQGDVFLVLSRCGGGGRLPEWTVQRLNEWDVHAGHCFRELALGDIDGDGDLDVVLADEHLDLLMWLENPGHVDGQFWQARVIDKSCQ